MHDIGRYLEHRFGHALTKIDNQLTLFTDMSDGHAKEAGEENDLQHILTGHGVDDITGHDMNSIGRRGRHCADWPLPHDGRIG